MSKKETAEEKLLKIIEATKKMKSSSAVDPVLIPASSKSPFRFVPGLRQINFVLILGMVISVLFFLYEARNGVSLLQSSVEVSADLSSDIKDSSAMGLPAARTSAYYFDKMSQRNIFQPFEKKNTETVSTGKEALTKKMSKYKLVGIAWLDVPESATVMLEETSTHAIYFLKEGDKVEDVNVKTIYTDRVVFRHANEEITIKL